MTLRRSLLAPLVLLLCACGGSTPGPDSDKQVALAPAIHFYEKQDALWVARNGGGELLLADDGRAYDAHASPDGRWIVIEVSVLSNLQTTRLTEWNEETETYGEPTDVSHRAWRQVAEKLDLALEDIENPRTRFVSWAEGGRHFRLAVSGWAPDGSEIDEIQAIPLDLAEEPSNR